MTNVRCGALGAAALLVGLGLAGCGPSDGRTATPLPETSATRQAIAEENLVHLWPLTVDRGTIECRERQYAIFVAPDGKEYGLNESAERKGFAGIDAIHKDGVSLGALRSSAIALCDNG